MIYVLMTNNKTELYKCRFMAHRSGNQSLINQIFNPKYSKYLVDEVFVNVWNIDGLLRLYIEGNRGYTGFYHVEGLKVIDIIGDLK